MTHICVVELNIIGSDNGLSPGRRQAIIWTNAGILLIGPLGTNFSEILIEILLFSFKKMRLKVSSGKRRPFCLGLKVLTHWSQGMREILKKTRQIWGIWKLWPAYSPKTPNLGQNRWCFVPCDLEIWWKNNRAPLLFYFKLCAAFRTHWWNQTGVTVRKCPIWVKFDDF